MLSFSRIFVTHNQSLRMAAWMMIVWVKMMFATVIRQTHFVT